MLHKHPDRGAATFFMCLACTICVHLTADMFSFGGPAGSQIADMTRPPFLSLPLENTGQSKEKPLLHEFFRRAMLSCVKEPL